MDNKNLNQPDVKLNFFWTGEKKFHIGNGLVDELIARVSGFAELDPFLQHRKITKGPVINLYFDSKDFYCYKENVGDFTDTIKLRLRTYYKDITQKTLVGMEIKRKHNSLVNKDRIIMDYGKVLDVLNRGKSVADSLPSKEYQVLTDFLSVKNNKNMSPRLSIIYDRAAYVGFDQGNKYRITFDSNLRAMPSAALISEGGEIFLPGKSVFEIKYQNKLPNFIVDIIKEFQLKSPSKASKYCLALEKCFGDFIC